MDHVQRICDGFKKHKVPLTLVHGDLDPANIVKSPEGGYRFLDFGYTCISFPFIDAACLGDLPRVVEPEFDGLDFYLEMWTMYEPLPRLRELLALANEFFGVLLMLRGYQIFRNAEESRLEEARELAGLPASQYFDK